MRASLGLVLPLLAGPAAWAQEAPEKGVRHRLPALSSVFPQGAEPGTTLRVEALGESLDRAQSVLFLDPWIRGRVLESGYTRLGLEFQVSAEAPLGPHYFRVVSPRGASSLLLFRVGDQPHRLEREPNNSLAGAEAVSLPVTINGRLNLDGDFDFYRFRAEVGQSWIFDLRAARNGNGLDAALILLDAEGRKLAHSEDAFIWDPFLIHQFARAGAYYVVVQPTHARLDPGFAYQLDIRTAPHLDTVSPISLAPGVATEVTLFGAGLWGASARLWFDRPGLEGEVLELRGSSARARIGVPAGAPPGERRLALATAGGRSNPATFLIDDTPAHAGGEEIRPPASIRGVARYRQPERFFFQVEPGQSLVFEVRAQRFGSPVDSFLRILDARGKQVAANDDAAFPGAQFNKDSRIAHRFAEGGRYLLEMRNLWATSGENFPYQLLVKAPQPGFELMLAADQPYVYPGETARLKVTAARRDGFEGAIRLRIAGLPEGVSAEPAEIAAGKNEVEIVLCAGQAPPGTYGQVEVSAEAEATPAWRSARISSGGGEGAATVRVERATLAVAEKPLFSLEAAANNVNVVRGGSAEAPIGIQRAPDFHGEIRFRVENLPPGLSAEPVVAPPGSTQVRIALRASPDAAPGRHPRLVILGATAEGHVQAAPRVGISVD